MRINKRLGTDCQAWFVDLAACVGQVILIAVGDSLRVRERGMDGEEVGGIVRCFISPRK